MPQTHYLPEKDVFQALEEGALLLTVNRRLSRSMLQRFTSHQASTGRTAWETPDILPLSSWIMRCMEEITYHHPDVSHPLPITRDQELSLWEDIIRQSPHSRGLLHLEETARQAARAWTLFEQWNLQDHQDPALWSSPDHRAFLEWSTAFRDYTQSRGWMEEARHTRHVARMLEKGCLPCPAHLVLAGLENLSPVQEHILDVLESLGCKINHLEPARNDPAKTLLPLADREQEMRTCALWVRTRLESDHEQRIGVVVPDLYSVRQEIIHTFDALLHPDTAFEPLPPEKRAYDLSLGRPLSGYPLIRSALHLLDLRLDPLPLETVSAVLNTPFLKGAKSETPARSGLETLLRKTREPQISFSFLLDKAADSSKSWSCLVLARSLKAFQARIKELPSTQPPSAWAQDLDLLLQDLGWPGDITLSSHEYQTVQAFNACLKRLAGLDRVMPSTGMSQATQTLSRILNETIFQPEPPEVRVRIMGMLEAESESFDELWIMGLTDQAWPQSPEPSPFLPVSLQKHLDMPRSSPQHELDYARRIMHRLLQNPSRAILSYPCREEDLELLPSPLLREISGLEFNEPGLLPDPDPWSQLLPGKHLEYFQNEQAPPLSQASRAPGGTGVLRSQALCPFQAFARHRMHARSLEEPVVGLGPPERGIIMHAALEYFWQSCRDQAALLNLTGDRRLQMIDQAVDQAIREMHSQRPQTMTSRFQELERERLQDLLQEWLALEEQRQPFQVQELEKRSNISINGLELNVVADRMDRLEDGRLVVIDYKSGRHAMSEWFKKRPVEPQVPLYTLFCPEHVAGVYFGVVRKGECAFVGLGQEDGIVPGCKGFASHKLTSHYQHWDELLQDWKKSLEKLAQEFMQGQARVDPESPNACRQCDLESICRIFETGQPFTQEPPDVT
ncbi:PD-(D/E)XK nuclease family protein [Desulfonatronospira sp.]|uniref:PD-(D/E)XK nuclease family protein n=1 Tax=Desulfonatronospira sp. TaxID=1962951 RepID=UPI0025C3CB7E|nr:PD-(D/E)XK nuclease family protein [Desulfonatronospira sp.]